MRSERGQTSTEYMLMVSVIVLAVVAAAYVFVPTFRDGVDALAADVSTILETGEVGGVGAKRNDGPRTGDSPMSTGILCSEQAKDPRFQAMFDPPPCIPDPTPAPVATVPPLDEASRVAMRAPVLPGPAAAAAAPARAPARPTRDETAATARPDALVPSRDRRGRSSRRRVPRPRRGSGARRRGRVRRRR